AIEAGVAAEDGAVAGLEVLVHACSVGVGDRYLLAVFGPTVSLESAPSDDDHDLAGGTPLLDESSRSHAPQAAPTTEMFRSSRRFAATVGMRPSVKPTTTSRPPGARQRRLSSNPSPPTGSTMTSAPCPLLSERRSDGQSAPLSTTVCAPAVRATSAFGALLV